MNKLYFSFVALLFCVTQAFAQSGAFYFIQMSDPQFGMLDGNKSFSKETKFMEQTVKIVNKLNPEFIVFTGDLVNDGKDKAQISEFKRICGLFKKEIPVYVLPGNHDLLPDVNDDILREYKEEYGYDRFSFRTKNTCFIGVNTPIIFSDRKEHEQEQWDWLENELKASQDCKHRIMFSHYSFFVKTPDEPDQYFNIPLAKRGKYIDLFNQYKVGTMFSGHLHYNSEGRAGGFNMVTSSALCYPLGKDQVGFRVVKVYPDRIESVYYNLNEVPSSIEL